MIDLEIFIGIEGEIQGPFSPAELAHLWESGDLGTQALYWHRSMLTWRLASEFQPPDPTAVANAGGAIVLSTTPVVAGEEVVRVLGIVTAAVVEGVGFVSDMAAGITDLAGGRSTRLETALSAAQMQCVQILRERAQAFRADAVVGVTLSVSDRHTKLRLFVSPPSIQCST